MSGLKLAVQTSSEWLATVLGNFDEFLLDHAANERKASAMALSLVAHYPDRPSLIEAMIDLALEELNHFRQVVRIINKRGLVLKPDEKDQYINQLRGHMNKGSEDYFLDRLLSAAVIEARGAERFALLAAALDDTQPDLSLTSFYQTLTRSENNHYQLFLDQANGYFDRETVQSRLVEWLEFEKSVIQHLSIRPRLH